MLVLIVSISLLQFCPIHSHLLDEMTYNFVLEHFLFLLQNKVVNHFFKQMAVNWRKIITAMYALFCPKFNEKL